MLEFMCFSSYFLLVNLMNDENRFAHPDAVGRRSDTEDTAVILCRVNSFLTAVCFYGILKKTALLSDTKVRYGKKAVIK